MLHFIRIHDLLKVGVSAGGKTTAIVMRLVEVGKVFDRSATKKTVVGTQEVSPLTAKSACGAGVVSNSRSLPALKRYMFISTTTANSRGHQT